MKKHEVSRNTIRFFFVELDNTPQEKIWATAMLDV